MSNVAYFSPWRPHGNRVSKTRFITLINIREEPRISENTRKEPRERERKKKKRERRSRPRPCTVCDQVMPRQRATRLRFDPLRSDPNLSLSLSLSLLFFGCSESFERNQGVARVDDPCGDGDLSPWSGVTCSTQDDYRVVTELYASFFVSFGIFTIWWILFKFLECDCFFLIVLGLGILSPSDLIVLGLRLLHFWIS